MTESPPPGKKGPILGAIGLLGITLFKFKAAIFVGLKSLSFLKMAWLFKSFLSMFIMLGIYTVVFGPLFAVIVVTLLFIHEAGHFVFMKYMGLEPKLGLFIPFVGAYTSMGKMPPDEASHAWVAIGGPLVGGVSSVIFFYLGVTAHIPALMAAGATGCLLNLFQLIPVKPFDGGFILGAVNKWLLVPGTGILFTVAWHLHSGLLMVIGVVSAFMTVTTLIKHQAAKNQAPEYQYREEDQVKAATTIEKLGIGLSYFVLTGVLAYLYWMTTDQTMVFLPSK
jgi:Zn-dependent protease